LSEREILGWLKFDAFRKIFVACMETPKLSKELQQITGIEASDLAEKLEIMHRYKMLSFSDGKWKAPESAIEIWRKYYD